MIEVILRGNTYGIKDTLKGLGFKWNGKNWTKEVKDQTEAEELANRWTNEGVYGTVTNK